MSVPLTMILGWVRSRSTSIPPPRVLPLCFSGAAPWNGLTSKHAATIGGRIPTRSRRYAQERAPQTPQAPHSPSLSFRDCGRPEPISAGQGLETAPFACSTLAGGQGVQAEQFEELLLGVVHPGELLEHTGVALLAAGRRVNEGHLPDGSQGFHHLMRREVQACPVRLPPGQVDQHQGGHACGWPNKTRLRWGQEPRANPEPRSPTLRLVAVSSIIAAACAAAACCWGNPALDACGI